MARKATEKLKELEKEMKEKEMKAKTSVYGYEAQYPNDIAKRYVDMCTYLEKTNNLYLTNTEISQIALELIKLENK